MPFSNSSHPVLENAKVKCEFYDLLLQAAFLTFDAAVNVEVTLRYKALLTCNPSSMASDRSVSINGEETVLVSKLCTMSC